MDFTQGDKITLISGEKMVVVMVDAHYKKYICAKLENGDLPHKDPKDWEYRTIDPSEIQFDLVGFASKILGY